uniref:coiled-coil domain-containing protein 144B-like n=1 Tax=Macaca mulatta TaxID=9544 RepID=UPI0010A24F59|nr:coiled-coil domain-containing protein 144B-like [Macaca mulatta]
MTTLLSAFSALDFSNEIHERSENLKVSDLCPFVSPPMTKTVLGSTDLGQMNLIDQEKMTTAAAFLFWNYTLHDLCESQLPENKESKEEQDLEVTSEQKPEKLEGSEKNKPQAEGERKKHARNETEASRNLHDGSTDDHIQQGESGETDGQQIPRTEHEECDR